MLSAFLTTRAGNRLLSAFAAILDRADREGPGLLRVLTYHRVEWSTADPSPNPSLTVSPDAFAAQMRLLRERFHPVSVTHVLEALRDGPPLPPRSVLVTFDDAYRDFGDQAWPIMRSEGIRPVLFVPTAYPDHPDPRFWWDDLHLAMARTSARVVKSDLGMLRLDRPGDRARADRLLRERAKQLPHAEAMAWVAAICRELGPPTPPAPILGWDQLRRLAREGVTMGSHTRTHPLLTRIPSEEARREIAGSFLDLDREIRDHPRIFAYPAGAHNAEVVRILHDEGGLLGFTTVRGINQFGTDHPLLLRRIHVGRRTTPSMIRLQMAWPSVWLNQFHADRESRIVRMEEPSSGDQAAAN